MSISSQKPDRKLYLMFSGVCEPFRKLCLVEVLSQKGMTSKSSQKVRQRHNKITELKEYCIRDW